MREQHTIAVGSAGGSRSRSAGLLAAALSLLAAHSAHGEARRKDAGPARPAMANAMGCFRLGSDGRSTCLISVLRGRAQTEREHALLATTYWQTHQVTEANAAMRAYLGLFPQGPSAQLFRQRLTSPPPRSISRAPH